MTNKKATSEIISPQGKAMHITEMCEVWHFSTTSQNDPAILLKYHTFKGVFIMFHGQLECLHSPSIKGL